MSLYNALFGTNPQSLIVLPALGLESTAQIPRFRDAFFVITEDKDIQLAIHTRTGGGNRDYYDSKESYQSNYGDETDSAYAYDGPWNSDLRELPGFIRDEDMEFDNTYATFFYAVPEAWDEMIRTLVSITGEFATVDPSSRWKKLLEGMKNQKRSEDVDRAIAVGNQILSSIAGKLDPTNDNNGDDDDDRNL